MTAQEAPAGLAVDSAAASPPPAKGKPGRTPAEARAAGLVALTVPDRPSAKVETVLGPVPWSNWCRKEAERVRAAGRLAEIVKDENGKLSVWVSPSPHLRPEQA